MSHPQIDLHNANSVMKDECWFSPESSGATVQAPVTETSSMLCGEVVGQASADQSANETLHK